MRDQAAVGNRRDFLSDRTKEEKKEPRGGAERKLFYATLSALFSAVALGGLLLGFVMRGSVGALIAGGEPILHGSYLGIVIEILRGSVSLPEGGEALTQILPVFLYFASFALALAVLVSLALGAMTAILPKQARKLCLANGFLVFFAYGAVCVASALLGSLRAEIYTWRQFDLPSLTAALASFCLLSVLALSEKGLVGAVNALLLLFSSMSVCAFVFPGTPLLADLDLVGTAQIGMGKQIAFGAYAVFLLANLLFSGLGLFREKKRTTDILRFALQFTAALGIAAAYLAGDGTLETFFTSQFLSVLFLFLSPLSALLLSAFAAAMSGGKRRTAPSRGNARPNADGETLKREAAISAAPPRNEKNETE